MSDSTEKISDIIKQRKIHIIQNNLPKNITDSEKKRPYTYEELLFLRYPKNN